MPRCFLLMVLCCPLFAAGKVLIVADEFPAMEALAVRLKSGGIDSEVVKPAEMPAELKGRPAVIVYIHRTLGEPAETAIIDYAKSGGKIILLHHSISSGKRSNKYWFPFLGVQLPEGDIDHGGYKYFEGIILELVNLAPDHYVTTHRVKYDGEVRYKPSDGGLPEASYPVLVLRNSEVYFNHVLTSPKHLLLGVKAADPKTGKVYMQDRAAWYQRTGKGWVFYFMPGHSATDFENPAYSQMVVNAVSWKPRE